jgi:hypothetical protein
MSCARLQSPGKIDYIQCDCRTSSRSTPLSGYYSSLCLLKKIMYGRCFLCFTPLFPLHIYPISLAFDLHIKPVYQLPMLLSPRRYPCAPHAMFQSHRGIFYHTRLPKDTTNAVYRITINSHSASSPANGLMSIFPPSPKREASLSPLPRQMPKCCRHRKLLQTH